mmetsp:Transcript_47260/g.145554  ORF Transcript_47260/g.145554 Transcript_47260/m.145554 type:complete len:330 (-) Transcript_47260:7-996(-)
MRSGKIEERVVVPVDLPQPLPLLFRQVRLRIPELTCVEVLVQHRQVLPTEGLAKLIAEVRRADILYCGHHVEPAEHVQSHLRVRGVDAPRRQPQDVDASQHADHEVVKVHERSVGAGTLLAGACGAVQHAVEPAHHALLPPSVREDRLVEAEEVQERLQQGYWVPEQGRVHKHLRAILLGPHLAFDLLEGDVVLHVVQPAPGARHRLHGALVGVDGVVGLPSTDAFLPGRALVIADGHLAHQVASRLMDVQEEHWLPCRDHAVAGVRRVSTANLHHLKGGATRNVPEERCCADREAHHGGLRERGLLSLEMGFDKQMDVRPMRPKLRGA